MYFIKHNNTNPYVHVHTYTNPHLHVHVVNPGYYECGPVQLQESNMYEQLSEMKENEPNAYEVPVSSSKNKKEEWAKDRNPANWKDFCKTNDLL